MDRGHQVHDRRLHAPRHLFEGQSGYVCERSPEAARCPGSHAFASGEGVSAGGCREDAGESSLFMVCANLQLKLAPLLECEHRALASAPFSVPGDVHRMLSMVHPLASGSPPQSAAPQASAPMHLRIEMPRQRSEGLGVFGWSQKRIGLDEP